MAANIWRPPITPVFQLNGLEVELIPLGPRHRDLLAEAFSKLSDRSRYFRFMAPVTQLSASDLSYLTEMDMIDRFAWGLLVDGEPAAVGRYARTTTTPSSAEVGIAVLDAYQAKGLGWFLVHALATVARACGFARFEFEVLNDNEAMIKILTALGATFTVDSGITHGEVDIDAISDPPIDPDLLLDAVGAARAERASEAGA